jgi:rhamnulose-1-phosphate aldolase
MSDLTPSGIDEIAHHLGQAGLRLAEIGAAEGAAGNMSVCVRRPPAIDTLFPVVTDIELPYHAPDLAGMMVVVTGSGRRLRDVAESTFANLACVLVEPGGRTGKLFTSPQAQFGRVTSEFNSHLAVHHDRMRSSDIKLHTVVHAQPLHLTMLSHQDGYQDEKFLNRRLLRWQPETILNMPEGIGVVLFLLPGSAQLVLETQLSLRERRIVVWARHGVMARADDSVLHAVDLIEYAETAAHYEYLNLISGETGGGLSTEEICEICAMWNVRQSIF